MLPLEHSAILLTCIKRYLVLKNMSSDQGLYCLLTECSMKIRLQIKNTTQDPLKREWTGPIDISRKFHSAYKWVKICLRMPSFNTTEMIPASITNLGKNSDSSQQDSFKVFGLSPMISTALLLLSGFKPALTVLTETE